MQALMTEELAEGLPPLYATEGEGDPVALVHYFSCLNGWDWYLTEYDPETGEGVRARARLRDRVGLLFLSMRWSS